jgi:hypothetical protein
MSRKITMNYLDMNFNYMPSQEHLLFTINAHPILSIGNMLGITANIGAGKSQICEIFASYWINPSAAIQAINSHNTTGKCLYIDTERTPNDCYQGLCRIKQHTQLSQDEIMNKLIYKSGIAIEETSEKITYLEEILKNHTDIRLLIVDGILDLINNPNDFNESNTLGQLLISWANIYHIGVIYTLHGNRNDTSGKGKGHVGDVFQRKSESYLRLIQKQETRILTSDFSNGKVRNGYDKVSTMFKWNNSALYLQEQSSQILPVSQDLALLKKIFNQDLTIPVARKPLYAFRPGMNGNSANFF